MRFFVLVVVCVCAYGLVAGQAEAAADLPKAPVLSVQAFVEQTAPHLKIDWTPEALGRANQSKVWFSRLVTVKRSDAVGFIRRVLVGHGLYLHRARDRYRVVAMRYDDKPRALPEVRSLDQIAEVEWDIVRCVVKVDLDSDTARSLAYRLLPGKCLGFPRLVPSERGDEMVITDFPSCIDNVARVIEAIGNAPPQIPMPPLRTRLALEQLDRALDRLTAVLEENNR